MGLFSRKKKVELPTLPPDNLLKFPQSTPTEREIIPDKIKQDVGLNKKETPFFEKDLPETKEPKQVELFQKERTEVIIRKPFFLRVNNYQKLLTNIELIEDKNIAMEETIEKLEKSEYNENKNYESLKNSLKKIHDRLLFMDDLIFKK